MGERLEIVPRCLRSTKNDQLWDAYAWEAYTDPPGRIGPTVQAASRKKARTKARSAFVALYGPPTKDRSKLIEAIERRIEWAREVASMEVTKNELAQVWPRRYEMDCSALIAELEKDCAEWLKQADQR